MQEFISFIVPALIIFAAMRYERHCTLRDAARKGRFSVCGEGYVVSLSSKYARDTRDSIIRREAFERAATIVNNLEPSMSGPDYALASSSERTEMRGESTILRHAANAIRKDAE